MTDGMWCRGPASFSKSGSSAPLTPDILEFKVYFPLLLYKKGFSPPHCGFRPSTSRSVGMASDVGQGLLLFFYSCALRQTSGLSVWDQRGTRHPWTWTELLGGGVGWGVFELLGAVVLRAANHTAVRNLSGDGVVALVVPDLFLSQCPPPSNSLLMVEGTFPL